MAMVHANPSGRSVATNDHPTSSKFRVLKGS